MFFTKIRARAICLNIAVVALSMSACTPPGGDPDAPILSLESVSPQRGSIYGGTEITLKGQGFEVTDHITVGDNACAPVKFISDKELRCVASPHAAGKVDVALLKNGKEEDFLAEAFTYGCVIPGAVGTSVWANDGHDKIVAKTYVQAVTPQVLQAVYGMARRFRSSERRMKP